MGYENVVLEKQGHIATLSFNRPRVLNALNSNVLNELDKVLNEIEEDKDIYVVIITGYGKAFVAGADILEMKDKTPEESRKFAELGLKVFRKIELMEKPIIAAVNGFALGGGCELAMSCDIRIASEKAKFGQPEVGLGIIPGFAGTQRLSRLIGIGKAKELIFTSNLINAVEAEKLGLVNKVVEHDHLMLEAISLAENIVSKAQLAVRYSKTSINRGIESDIETGMSIEKDLFGLCFATEDQKEGMSAFLEKREANFKNK
ncbi:crotonase [Clostridium carboxidivorans P7]|uniref:short-chain-enoyl-CoA hydratase n=1 Tax=Clostridium carboxidivorans P7 TaxID=536227 RepID=C6PR29_9CLOT|nr:short-chain-enoyl-CoA hydratase [Clostridium carboxidivorans]AKN29570.1 crotonase [Clostridium carboxidivorans P7]EET88253.1 Enoyl-CoA hydratase/isomerase [Clostridium carboxidivorans P7]EFG89504.1 3-hydroxybutyryl-CoA dehydratase [Clostridium carboxidivorans P7]